MIVAQRQPPLNPVQDTPGNYFDDKMAVINASVRDKYGTAMPASIGMARKPVFLHDDSVSSLDELLDPKRGDQAPHLFYFADSKDRKDMADFLRSLDTGDAK